ncbi:hypothetical protein G9A89_023351 [Geosiphon pyriformis]|nr:hypothetical protein G9A89_023351 [Geosiphon pyriformis]
MGTCCDNDEEYQMATKFYCRTCHVESCGETLLNKGMWNNIPERRRTCNMFCQYMILISNWIEKRTPIKATWRKAVQRLDSCLHNDDKIWRMTIGKIEGATPEEIREIKNNPPEPIELN